MTPQKDQRMALIYSSLKICPNFPKEGIPFVDIFGIFANPKVHRALIDIVVERVKSYGETIDAIVGLEARGLVFGPQVALELQIPFVPVRKHGKLPGKVCSLSYELEYGKDTIDMQLDILKPGSKVVIMDDLLATGGTLNAAQQLCVQVGYEVIGTLVIIELLDLKGRKNLKNPGHVSAVVQLSDADIAAIDARPNDQTTTQ